MEKNWIIRTRSLQILGPVSKEKIIELIDGGTLSEEDEICQGNGYWFFVSEKDLIEKYLRNNEPSEFNPISEAIESERLVFQAPLKNNDPIIPENEDLEYPVIGEQLSVSKKKT